MKFGAVRRAARGRLDVALAAVVDSDDVPREEIDGPERPGSIEGRALEKPATSREFLDPAFAADFGDQVPLGAFGRERA
jgi:hypothetical protein